MTNDLNIQFIVKCPICGKPYQRAPGIEQPTCGDPNCFREARTRGLPFATIRKSPPGKRISPKKRTRGKRQTSGF